MFIVWSEMRADWNCVGVTWFTTARTEQRPLSHIPVASSW